MPSMARGWNHVLSGRIHQGQEKGDSAEIEIEASVLPVGLNRAVLVEKVERIKN